MNKITACVIGIGRIGMLLEDDLKRRKPATHFGMFNLHPKINLVGVCDKNESNLKKATEMKPEIKTFTDARKMISELKPNIISIATWKDTHYEMLKLCIDMGIKVIICEKPISEKVEHAEEIEKLARDKGVHILVNHRRRFDSKLYPFITDLKNGLIGEIRQANIYYVYGLYATGTHMIDSIRFFLKDICGEIISVIGLENKYNNFSFSDDPCIDAVIEFQSGLKVHMQSLNMKDYDIHDIHLYGTKGKIEFTHIGRSIKHYKVIDSPEHQNFTELSLDYDYYLKETPRNQFEYLADNAIKCLNGEGTSLSTIEDSTIALKVLHAIEKSSKNNSEKIMLNL